MERKSIISDKAIAKEEKDIANANKIKEKLAKEKIVFEVSTGKNSKVFGNISTKQIRLFSWFLLVEWKIMLTFAPDFQKSHDDIAKNPLLMAQV